MLTEIEAPAAAVAFVRWIATVYYRTERGLVDVEHNLIELDELADLVERGPNWNTIDHIDIVRADGREAGLTVEKAKLQ